MAESVSKSAFSQLKSVRQQLWTDGAYLWNVHLVGQGNLEEGISTLRKAIEIEPNKAEY